MSAKLRLTAWFTFMIVLLSAMVLVFVFVINGNSIDEDPSARLVKIVNRNAYRLEYERGRFEWEDIKFYSRGVYTLVYKEDGELLRGAYPEGLEVSLDFKETEIRTILYNGESYYVYDVLQDMDFTKLWFRGVISTKDGSGLMHVIIVLMWSLLPAILVLSIVGGWFIAVGTFHPIETIIAAAGSISDGQDLSARINLRHGPTEMKHLGHAFDKMFARLEKSFNAEKQFASDVSHELRTPVAVILAQVERSKKKDKTKEEFLQSMEVIENQGHHMTELIEELLSLTRLQQGVDRYPLKEENLSELVEAVCEEYVIKNDRGIKKATNIDENIMAKLNPLLISRIVQNLLTNAYKYGNENGRILVTLRREKKYAVLKVKDDGIGISEEDKDKIWQRFWQADPSRNEEGGSGLGLAMVKEMTEFHGGKVDIESKVGEGSTFIVKIPLTKEEIEKNTLSKEEKEESRKQEEDERKTLKLWEELKREKAKHEMKLEKKEEKQMLKLKKKEEKRRKKENKKGKGEI